MSCRIRTRVEGLDDLRWAFLRAICAYKRRSLVFRISIMGSKMAPVVRLLRNSRFLWFGEWMPAERGDKLVCQAY